jgi:hypothetical protein
MNMQGTGPLLLVTKWREFTGLNLGGSERAE